MSRVSHTTRIRAYRICLVAAVSGFTLIACDASIQLCGEYACVAYQSDCNDTHNCDQQRQCESPGSIRDRAPRIINQLREAQRACGANQNPSSPSSVSWDSTLASVSVSHSRDMADNQFESFVGSDGLTTEQRVMFAGITASVVVESISTGPQTTAAAINLWLDVNTDCENLLSIQTTRIGMACAVPENAEKGPYWSLLLASPDP